MSVKMSVTVSFFTTVVTEPGRVVIRVVPGRVTVVTDPESVTVSVILSVNVSVNVSVILSVNVSITVSLFTTVNVEPGRVVIRVVPCWVRVTVLPEAVIVSITVVALNSTSVIVFVSVTTLWSQLLP
jgi:hypothetical protein